MFFRPTSQGATGTHNRASTAPTGQDEAARRGRSSLRRARGRTLFRLALLTGLTGALAVPPPLLGQNAGDIDLVSNEGPSSSQEEIKPARRTVQRFTTGTNEDGYLLSAVHLLVEKITDHVTPVVTIHRQQRLGAPGPLVYTLENPATFVGAAASDSVDRNLVSHAFAASEGAVLHPDTRYSLQVWSSQGRFRLSLVDVDDDFGAAGWSISNGGQRRVSGRTGANWTAAQRVQKMRITGQLNDDRVVALGIELTSAGAYQPGEAIEATVTFSDAVTVAGTPTLALQVGDHSRDAAYVSGDGTSALVFSYTVVAGDYDEDGVSILPGSLSLPSGAGITEHGSTTDALLAHPDLSDQVTHKVNAGPWILAGRAGIRFTSMPAAAGSPYGLGETMEITATFSAPVFVDTTAGIPTIEMTFGTNSAGYEARAAGYVLGSGSTDLVFAYVVRSGDTDSDGVTVDRDRLELDAATIQDADGLDAQLAHRAFTGAGVDAASTTDVATLAGLSLSHGTLTPAFAAATTSYTATVSQDIAVTTVGTNAASDVTTSVFPLDADANTAGHQVSLGAGYNVISVTVSKTGAADRTYTVTVARDGPPVFTSLPTYSVEENQVFAGEVVALDVGADDRISGYGITGGADSEVFELAPVSGTLEFANAPDGPDFEDPQDADRDNVYEMEVTATSVNQSDASEATVTQAITVTVLDVPERPARPAAPTVEAGSTTSLLVSWQAPGTNGGPDLIGYEVRYRVSGTGSWTGLPHTGTGTSATIVDALADTGYDAQVRALNGDTPSEWSPTGSGPSALPGPPTDLDATATGPDAIRVSWSAPTDTGNSSITGYRIEVSSDAGANWSDLVADSGTAATAHRHTGLPASATRHYRVSALNTVGEGSPSGVADATTGMATLHLLAFDDAFDEASATVPVKVQLSHPSEVRVTVDYATSDGGGSADASSPGDYEATSGMLTIAPPATRAEFTVAIADDTLWESTEHFTVTLSNPGGAALGLPGRAVAIADDDPAPTVSFRQTQHEAIEGTDAYVDLIIDKDAPAGRAVRIGVDVADDTAQVSADYEPPASTFVILAAAVQEASVRIAIIDDADVERSERFTVTLDDVDNTGIGLTDAVATVTIESDDTVAPDAPTNLTASPTATDQVRLAWEAPGSDPYYGEGAEVTGYVIEVSTDGGVTWTVLTASTGSIATVYTDAVTPAPAQGERSYRVSAINSAGVGPPSNEAVSGQNAATGALAITGTAQVDEPLTVDTDDVRDPDGLDQVVYRYQWIRVDGGDETDIAGAVAATYTPVAADLGKTLKVRVSFTDDLGGEEELTSAATTPVAAPTPAAVVGSHLNFLGVRPPGLIFTPGTTLVFSVEFDKAVDVSGQPRLKLRLSENGSDRGYVFIPFVESDSTSTALTFSLQVTGEHDSGLISILSDSVDLNGGSIRNADTQTDAEVSGISAFDFAWLDTRRVEDIAVTSSPALSWSPSTYGPGETVEFTATFSEAVTLELAGGVPRLWLEFAGAAHYAEYARGSGSNALVFAWTVPSTGFSVWASLLLQGNVTPGTSTLRAASGLDPNGAEMTDDAGLTVNVRHGEFPLPSWVDTLAPVLPGSAAGATVNGFDLVLTYRVGENSADSEPLDPYSKPAPGDFSVTATGSDSVSTAHLVSRVNVAREAATVALTLADPVADGDVVTLDYTPGANPVQDLWGNAAIALAGRTVRNDTPGTVNTPASGAPTISGTTQDRHELTAATGAIMDADGLTGVSYRYQWIRVHGSSEADIADATGSTYVLTADDRGRTIRVRVTFTDDAGHVEALISTATATVTAAPPFVSALAFASTAPANGYASGDEVRISVGFNEAVTVGGAPQLSLAIGTATVAADYHGGSGSAVLTFRHTVTAADPAGAGLSVPADALGLNGGTIAATATALAAVLTHDALAAGSGQVIIGGSAATIERVAVTSTPAASATYGGGEQIEVTVTFSQRVEVTGTPYLQVLVGDGRGTATNFEYGGGSGTDALVFAWTVPFGASDGNGIRIDPHQLFGTIATQGTSADLDHNGQGTLSDHKIAAVPGVVTGLGATAGHGQVTLEWDRPPAADGYDSITGYEYRIVTAGVSGAWQEVPDSDRDTVSHAVTGLDAVETTFEVRAENAAGGGPAASATATPSPRLGQVTNVVVTVGPGHGQLTVSWDPVSAADGYKVQWQSGSQSFADAPADGREQAVSGGSTTTATLTGLTREEYGVRVIATRTGNVDGRPSAAHTGTPTAANTPAAGAPVITGTAQQNMTLTADTSGISDADGLSNVTYRYLWTRVDGSDESVIAGAASSTYVPVAADVDNRIKVTVSFTDDAGNAESLSSDPYPASGTIAMAPGICGRTPAVRDAILARIAAVSDCADVTATHLTGITGTLTLGSPSITTLAPGDFAGLSALTKLDLFANDLTTLPAGVFAGLSALTTLVLNGNDLTTLPDRVFAELSALTTLKLSFNELTELPAKVFAGLGALTRLDLNNNALQTLPARVFRGLNSLTELHLIHNALQTLPARAFAGLSALPTLDLSGNELETLSAEVFRGLSALTTLDLSGNELETLSAGVFTGLGALTTLDLSGNELETLAETVFEPLGALTTLDLSDNALETLAETVFEPLGALTTLDLYFNELETLPAGVFVGLDELTTLDLEDNDLTTLPDAVFEPLTALTNLRLRDNPGAPFAPGAVALPDGGTVPDTGGTVMLDASGSGGSWGTNVTYAWALTEPASGVSVTFDDDASVTPQATVLALAADTELVFTLTVTGRGGAAGIDTASDTATVTVTATAASPFVSALAFASTAPANGYASGDEVRISVAFDEAVTVGGAPQLSLAIGTATVAADYHGGSGSTVLTFRHTVTAADPAGAGLSVPADALGLNGGTIAATATGLAAVLTHDALAAESGQVIIGGSAATIESVAVTSTPAASATYGGGEQIEVTFTFSQRVEVTGAPYLRVHVGNGAGTGTTFGYDRGSGTDELVFAWTVPFGATDGNGIQVRKDRLFVRANYTTGAVVGVIATQGTDADRSHAGTGVQSGHRIAAVPRAVTGLSATAGFGRATLEWDLAQDAGEYDSITGYEYRIVASGSGAWQEVPDSDRDTASWTVAGLDAVPTTFEVRATNAAGEGPASAPAHVTPDPPPPAQVTGVTVTPGVLSLTVSWAAVGTADGYRVQWKVGRLTFADAPAHGREQAVTGGSTTTATIAGLEGGELYTVRVIATSAAGGAGEPSAQHTRTPGSPATGAPVIAGTPAVGAVLTARTGGIADADGLSGVTYRYQWIRVDGGAEADITGAAAQTYTPVDDDEGMKLRVRVSFTDRRGFAETLTSGPTAPVALAAPAITARYATLGAGIEDLVLTLTRAGATTAELQATVTIAQEQAWLAAANLSHAVTFAAGSASAELRIPASDFSFTPATGGALTATVSGTGIAGSAEVAVISIAEPPITVRYDQPAYTFAEGAADVNIYLLAALDPAYPRPPTRSFPVSYSTKAGTAESPEDYPVFSKEVSFAASEYRLEDGSWVARKRPVPYGTFVLGHDPFYEDPEQFYLIIEQSPGLPRDLVQFAFPDGTTCEPMDCYGPVRYPVTIIDDQAPPGLSLEADPASLAEHDGNVSTLTVEVTGVPFAHDQIITLTFAGSAVYGTHYTVTPADFYDDDYDYDYDDGEDELGHQVELPAAATAVQVTVTAAARDTYSGHRSITVTGSRAGTEYGTATITLAEGEAGNSAATGVPVITGTPRVGAPLTADTSLIGDADGLSAVAYRYQWIRVDGGNETDITRAAAHTYTPVDDDEGMKLKVRVSFTDDGGHEETLTSPPTAAVAPPLPVVTVVIAAQHATLGAGIEDLVLTLTRGGATTGERAATVTIVQEQAWLAAADLSRPVTFAAGSASAELRIPASDFSLTPDTGGALTATVSGPGIPGAAAEVEVISIAEPPITLGYDLPAYAFAEDADPADVNVSLLATLDPAYPRPPSRRFSVALATVPGTALADVDYVAVAAQPSIAAADFRLEHGSWVARKLLGAGSAGSLGAGRFAVVNDAVHEGDEQLHVTVAPAPGLAAGLVRFALPGGATCVLCSPYPRYPVTITDEEDRGNVAPTGMPAITGTPLVGQPLTADPSAIMDADGLSYDTYAYQWIRVDGADAAAIAGATGRTYTPVWADLGKALRVAVAFTDDVGHGQTVTSSPTAPVASLGATVTSVGFTSLPSDRVYDLGESIEVSVTFSEPVDVTGAPRVRVEVGGGVAYAGYVSAASSDTVLVFRHAVTGAADNEANGVVVPVDGLELAGGAIRNRGAVFPADPTHARAVGPRTRTRLVRGIEVTSTPRVPAADSGGIATYGPGETIVFTVNFRDTVDVSGTPVLKFDMPTARHDAAYAGGTGSAALRFAWTVPASPPRTVDTEILSNIQAGGATPFTDRGLVLDGAALTDSGGRTVNVRHAAVTPGARVDTAPPVLRTDAGGATVDGARLDLTYWTDGASFDPDRLDPDSAPAAGDFTVTAVGTVIAVSTVEVVDEQTVRLILSQAVRHGQAVTLDYTPGATPIRDRWHHAAAALSGRTVRNDTAVSTDAALADLVLSGVTLVPAFDAAGVTYTADVAHAVAQTTVTATAADARATVAYLDGAGVARADAEPAVAGHQVNLSVHANVIGVQVTAEDGSTSVTYTVTVRRAPATNAAPVLPAGPLARALAENTAAGVDVGAAVAATDADGDPLTYRLAGADAAAFAIDPTGGQLRTAAGVDYDHEAAQNSYSVTVTVADGYGGTDSVPVRISVTDVDEQAARPAAPRVAATAATTDSVDVTWTQPGLAGGPEIIGYDVRYRVTGQSGWLAQPHSGTGTTATIAGLAADTSHEVQVLTRNGESPSRWSPPGHGSTGAPTPVAIAAQHARLGAGLEHLVLTLTRSGAVTDELTVAVHIFQDQQWLAAADLVHEVTFAAGSSTATLRLDDVEFSFMPDTTGDLVASVAGDGIAGGAATVEMISIAEPPITVSLDQPAYTFAETDDMAIFVIATLHPEYPRAPPPNVVKFSVLSRYGTAESPEDYPAVSFEPKTEGQFGQFDHDGNSFVSRTRVPVWVIHDQVYEGTESFALIIGEQAGLTPYLAQFARPDGTTVSDYDAGPQDEVIYTVTITDDDLPVLSLDASAVSIAEQDDGRTARADHVSTLTLAVANGKILPYPGGVMTLIFAGSAVYGSDYTVIPADADRAIAGHQVVMPSSGIQYVETEPVHLTVTAAGNHVIDGDRSIAVTGSWRGTDFDAATIAITDDDERGVTVTPTRLQVSEGSSGTYTVVLTSVPTDDVTVAVTAPSGTDVTVYPESLRFTGTTWNVAQTVTVRAAGDADALAERAVTLTHQVSGADYGANGVTAADVEVAIVETDTPTLSVADVDAGEADGEMVFTVTLNRESSDEVRVDYEAAGATAEAGADYGAAVGTLMFPVGSTQGQAIRVSIVDDAIDEAPETFTVWLTGATNARLAGGRPALAATGTITDDDDRGVRVTPTELEVSEGASGSYTVVLTSEPTEEVKVTVTVPADAEFTVDQASLTFTAGDWSTEQTVAVTAQRDTDAVAAETVSIGHEVTGGDYEGEAAAGVAVTVLEADTANAELTLEFEAPELDDQDGTNDVTLGDVLRYEAAAVNGGNVPLTNVTVSDALTGGAAESCATLAIGERCEWSGSHEVTQADVDAGHVDNTVTAGADEVGDQEKSERTEVAQERELTLEKTASVDSFAGVGDEIVYTYTVSNSGTVTLAGTVTIEDDKIESGITCGDVPADGLGPGGTVTCTGSYTTEQADVDGSEVENTASATLAGVESAEVTELVTWVGQQTGEPTVSVGSTSGPEGDGSLAFSVRLSAASQQTVKVGYATADDTATAGSDYTAVEGELTFAAGTTELTIEVAIADDALDEEDERFTVTLSDAVNATLAATATATGTITDDDDRGVRVTPTDLQVSEGASGSYTVVLTSEPTEEVKVTVTVPADAEFTVDLASLTFTASTWETEQTVTVTAQRDADAVAAEAVTIGHEVSGGDYEGEAAAGVAVTVLEADTANAELTLEFEAPELDDKDGSGDVTLGDVLSYEAAAVNGGNVPLTNVTVSDDLTGAAEESCATLAIGERCAWSGSYEVRQADVDAGHVDNTVTAGADEVADEQASRSTTVAQERELTLEKTASVDSFAGVGDEIVYTYTVSNSGTVTLAGTVTIEDDKIESGITCGDVPADGLGPGGTVTCTGSYTTEQADVDGSKVENTASATLAGVTSAEVTELVVWIGQQTGEPTVSVGSTSGPEGAGSLAFSVRLSAASQQTVKVRYATADDTATAGSDYTAVEGELTFAAGATELTIEVAIAADALDEEDERFTVTLRDAVNATLAAATSTGRGTITDDDDRGVSVKPTDLEVNEGSSGTYKVELTSEPTDEVTVEMAVSGDADVTVDPSSLTFTAGDWATAQTVTVRAGADVDAEDDEAEIGHTVRGGDYEGEGAAAVTVTVADDETASTAVELSVDVSAVAEGGGERTITVTGTLDAAPKTTPTVVTVTVAGGTATEVTDFAAVEDFELTIAAGAESGTKTFALAPEADEVDEADETVTLGGTAAGLTVTGTQVAITDDDDRGVSVTPTRLEVNEGSSDSYTVVLESQPTADVMVTVTVPAGTDVTVDPASLTFTATTWRTEQTVTVDAASDTDALNDAAVELTHGVTGGDYEANGVTAEPVAVTIIEKDTPTLSVEDARADEADGEMVFTVSLSQASSAAVEVDYETADGTAESGADYTETSGTLTFAAESTQGQEIRVPIVDDGIDEAEEETFTVTLSEAANADLAGGEPTLTATGTIADDDDPAVTVSFEQSSYTASEGGTAATVTVRLSGDPERTVEIPLTDTPGGGAVAGDYAVLPGSVTFVSGATERTVTVTATDDAVDEGSENVELGFGAPLPAGVTVGTPSTATVTLIDDDTRGVTVEPTELQVNEGGSDGYTVVLTSEPTADVTVTVTVPAGTDVTVDQASLTFTAANWSTEQTVTVNAAADGDALADAAVELTHGVTGGDYEANAVTAEPVAVTIIEKDTPTLSVEDARADEADGEMVFTVSLSQASSAAVEVDYETADGTAQAGADYTETSGTLTFAAQSTQGQEIRVPIADDGNDEAEEETFTVTLSEAANADLAGGEPTLTATGTITDDDDPAVTVSFDQSSYTATEGGTAATVTVRLSGDPERTVQIPLTDTPGGGAVAGDYAVLPGSVTFVSGATERTVTVTATDDAVDEGSESVELGFGTPLPAGVTVGTQSTATVTLIDDDARGVSVEPTELQVNEGGSDGYTVVLTSEPTADVTVTVTVPAGTDVTVDQASLTFTATTWRTEQTVTVEAAPDDDALADGSVRLTHGVTGGDYEANAVTAEPVAVTIIETDTPTLSVEDARADEAAGEMVFTVSLSQASSAAVEVDYETADGTAESGADYTETSGTLTFAAESTQGQEIRVPIVDDGNDEAEEETFTVTLSGAVNATLAGGVTALTATGTIEDDDDPEVMVAFGQSSYTATEGGAAATVKVRLSGDPERTVEIALTDTPGGGAGAGDYTGIPASVTFGSGETERTVTVSATDDAVDEGAESVELGFGTLPAGVTSGTPSTATVTLIDDDERGVTVTPTRLQVDEGSSESYKEC